MLALCCHQSQSLLLVLVLVLVLLVQQLTSSWERLQQQGHQQQHLTTPGQVIYPSGGCRAMCTNASMQQQQQQLEGVEGEVLVQGSTLQSSKPSCSS
jgi:hypothetical protein